MLLKELNKLKDIKERMIRLTQKKELDGTELGDVATSVAVLASSLASVIEGLTKPLRDNN